MAQPQICDEVAVNDWNEIELRMRSLAWLERVWVKNTGASAKQLNFQSSMTSMGLSAGGEDVSC